MDGRYGDDRAFIGGDKVGPADFQLLATYTSMVANTGLKNPSVATNLTTWWEKCANLQRIVTNVKALGKVGEVVDALEPSWI